jgi:hypothetical protein
MKKYFVSLLLTCCLGFPPEGKEDERISFMFGGETWSFPSTVQNAFNFNKLMYKPPGYYYRQFANGMEVTLDYFYLPLDFANEYQPKEKLFSRVIHSYVFRFKNQPFVYDSLRNNLEQTYQRRFVLTKGRKSEKWGVYEGQMDFEYDFLTVSPDLTIGIKKNGTENVQNVVTVRFMFKLPVDEMGVHMGN